MKALQQGACFRLVAALMASALSLQAAFAGEAPQTAKLEADLVARFGESQRFRAHQGIAQVAALWRVEDGDATAFEVFVRDNFAGTTAELDALFSRYQHNLEVISGHTHEISRELNEPSDLDLGPVASYDESFAAWDPEAHLLDDLFANKLAFTALLNFPLTSLSERTENGPRWSRRQWAETQLAELFRQRVPASAKQAASDAYAEAGRYIAGYNVWMHHLVDARSKRLFPANLRLLSHWNLRDEIKADYGDEKTGLAKQRMIQRVMERIVAQEIPAIVIDNPAVDWNPFTNVVTPAAVTDSKTVAPAKSPIDASREPDARYARVLANFHAQQQIDRFSPSAPTHIARAFDSGRQLSEQRVQSMLEQVLAAPQVARTAQLIARRLGRPLEPFDIWYNGFRASDGRSAGQLDAITRSKYPNPAAYEQDIPNLLRKLGFAPDRADYVAKHIVVEAARGSGHAMGAEMRGEPAHLRTRVDKQGMDYKGYNIAVHEMCHNVEQTFSLNDIDYYSLHGVPNTAFTEALAFTCQNRDLELLGIAQADAQSKLPATLNDFWATYEIAGVALVDMHMWRWLYEHPAATPAQLREATLSISREIWNRWYAPVFGARDVTLLGIYSHMINETLYLPDYPIGHMIAFQVEAQMTKAGDFGKEFERVSRIGAVAPDLWMTEATGSPVGPEALLAAADLALNALTRSAAPQ
jgi:hypothetical protein